MTADGLVSNGHRPSVAMSSIYIIFICEMNPLELYEEVSKSSENIFIHLSSGVSILNNRYMIS